MEEVQDVKDNIQTKVQDMQANISELQDMQANIRKEFQNTSKTTTKT